jgi:hypothetical protein
MVTLQRPSNDAANAGAATKMAVAMKTVTTVRARMERLVMATSCSASGAFPIGGDRLRSALLCFHHGPVGLAI